MLADGATCLATRCSCEAVNVAGLAQPINAWSALAYVAVGLLVLIQRGITAHHERVLSTVLGVVLLAVGAASFDFHATLSRLGEFLAAWSMTTLATVVLAGGLVRTGLMRIGPAVLGGLALTAILLRVLWVWPVTSQWVFSGILVVGVALEVVRTRVFPGVIQPKRWLGLALGLLTAAYVIWVLDQSGVACHPGSVFQLHALWQVVGAAAAGCAARHYVVTSTPAPAPT
jgi:dihydroceramidase